MNGTGIDVAMGNRYGRTKQVLYRAKDAGQQVRLIEERIRYWEDASEAGALDHAETEIAALEKQLAAAETEAAVAKVYVSELISQVPDVNQQMVLTQKYLRNAAWDMIAVDMDISVRTAQKLHGRALPQIDTALIERYGEDYDPAKLS